MLLVPVHGGVRAVRIDEGSERVVGRDSPWTAESQQTGVTHRAISRAQVWACCRDGALIGR